MNTAVINNIESCECTLLIITGNIVFTYMYIYIIYMCVFIYNITTNKYNMIDGKLYI